MRGSSGLNTRPHTQLFPGNLSMDDIKTERSLASQARWVNNVLGLFFGHVIHGCLYSQTMVGVRLTGAGIKCL